MPEMQNQIKRQTAYKVRIKDILNNEYIKEDGWQPNYIEVNGNKISRINLVGTVVLKIDENNIVLDDGSGKITTRVFENNSFFEKIDIGDVVLLIGRPREFGSEKYILPEILKKIENPVWINVRKTELRLNNANFVSNEDSIKKEKVIEKNKVKEIKDNETISDRIFNLIKSLDKGEGVDVEEIMKNIKEKNVDDVVNKLLENGEIFEVKPGKIKILE